MTVGSENHFYLSFGMPQSEDTEQRGLSPTILFSSLLGSENHFFLSFGMPQSEHTEQRGLFNFYIP